MKRYTLPALLLVLCAGLVAFAASDAGTGSGMVRYVYGLYKASPSTLDDGEADALRLTSAGLLRVQSEGTSVADTEMSAAAAAADNTANPTAGGVRSFGHVWDGSTWDRAPGTSAEGLDVDVTRLPALATGAAIVGRVGIDQTTPGTTDSVSVSTAQGAGAVLGTTSGAKVITDANGTIQQYLRGIVALSGASSVSFNADVGANVDACVAAASGARLRGVVWTESAGTPGTFSFRITNAATGATGSPIFARAGAASESNSAWFGDAGIDVSSAGASIDWISGEVDVTLIYAAP